MCAPRKRARVVLGSNTQTDGMRGRWNVLGRGQRSARWRRKRFGDVDARQCRRQPSYQLGTWTCGVQSPRLQFSPQLCGQERWNIRGLRGALHGFAEETSPKDTAGLLLAQRCGG